MVYRTPLLTFRILFKKRKSTPFNNSLYKLGYFSLGRYALLKGLDLLDIKEEDNVLVPGYVCRTALLPFRLKKIRIEYYKIKKDLSIDINNLNKRIDKNTKALLYVNYFGLSNQLEVFHSFCKKNNIYLIEDNAHTLMLDYRYLKGDISIFSLRKFLPIPDGAILSISKTNLQNKDINNIEEGIAQRWKIQDYEFILTNYLKKTYNWISNPFINYLLEKYRRDREDLVSQTEDIEDAILNPPTYSISRLSLYIIERTDTEQIFNIHKRNYCLLLEYLKKISVKNIKILFNEVNEKYCPLAFPILVTKNRDYFIKKLFINGFAVYPWPDMPMEIIKNDEYKDENFLFNTLVLLPIHSGLTNKKLYKMAKVIEAL